MTPVPDDPLHTLVLGTGIHGTVKRHHMTAAEDLLNARYCPRCAACVSVHLILTARLCGRSQCADGRPEVQPLAITTQLGNDKARIHTCCSV